MARPASFAQQTADRELAALVNGPWAPRWYWREDLEAMQLASRRTGHPDGDPAAVLRSYRPTQQWIDHPSEEGVRGRAWTYQPPERSTR